MTTVSAPWTGEQVENLRRWQEAGWVHPFTCGPCRNAATARGEFGEEYALEPTAYGWVCSTCPYTQDWCHDFMLSGPGPNPFSAFQQERQ